MACNVWCADDENFLITNAGAHGAAACREFDDGRASKLLQVDLEAQPQLRKDRNCATGERRRSPRTACSVSYTMHGVTGRWRTPSATTARNLHVTQIISALTAKMTWEARMLEEYNGEVDAKQSVKKQKAELLEAGLTYSSSV